MSIYALDRLRILITHYLLKLLLVGQLVCFLDVALPYASTHACETHGPMLCLRFLLWQPTRIGRPSPSASTAVSRQAFRHWRVPSPDRGRVRIASQSNAS